MSMHRWNSQTYSVDQKPFFPLLELILYLPIYFLFFPSKKTSGGFQPSNMSLDMGGYSIRDVPPRFIYFRENNI